MILLVVFAFVAGIVTILSPCILPVLPIILSSTVDVSGKRRPLGVVVGFVVSFTFFTLFLSSIVRVSGIPAEFLRHISVVILIVFGFSLLIPHVQQLLEGLLSKITSLAPKSKRGGGFGGGFILGLSLGLLWTPCVGPILASVISLALSGSVTGQSVIITLAYSLGTAIPMFAIMQTGSTALQKVPLLVRNTGRIQKAFGVLMVVTALGIFFNIDRRFQTFILNTFPTYGVGLTRIEDNESVKRALEKTNPNPTNDKLIGKPMSDTLQLKGPVAPEIIPGGQWFNLPDTAGPEGLTLESLRGKIVLIDFWTYSCINCQRTLPYLTKWYDEYKDKGLVIIGVHSPEFEFEKNAENVATAIKDFGLTYPVVQDNDFATWRAYNNRYWPAKYLIDKDGVIRYTHFGEGAYNETEKHIQDLLAETGIQDPMGGIVNPTYDTHSKTPETYLGYGRIENFASLTPIVPDSTTMYSFPSNLDRNQVAFEGTWTVKEEYAHPAKGSALMLDFDAKKVFLVMKPTGTAPSRVRVYVDGKQQYFGKDAVEGVVVVTGPELFELVDVPTPGRHTLRLEFEDEEVEVYAFTFG